MAFIRLHTHRHNNHTSSSTCRRSLVCRRREKRNEQKKYEVYDAIKFSVNIFTCDISCSILHTSGGNITITKVYHFILMGESNSSFVNRTIHTRRTVPSSNWLFVVLVIVWRNCDGFSRGLFRLAMTGNQSFQLFILRGAWNGSLFWWDSIVVHNGYRSKDSRCRCNFNSIHPTWW